MSGFSAEVTREGSAWVICVSGEVDVEHAEDLAAVGVLTVASMDGNILEIDMSQVPFIDSTGIGALVKIRNAALGTGRDVHVRRPHPRVRRVLTITGLTDAFGLDAATLDVLP